MIHLLATDQAKQPICGRRREGGVSYMTIQLYRRERWLPEGETLCPGCDTVEKRENKRLTKWGMLI